MTDPKPSHRKPSIKAAPAEACPNCGNWYAMGECRHASTSRFGGTLYGVCSYCADARDGFAERIIAAAHGT